MNYKFVDPSVELILEKDPFKKIEMAGRTCYKSEANITDESSKRFTKNLIAHQHTAMVEHAVKVFRIDTTEGPLDELDGYLQCLQEEKYLHVTSTFLETSVRVLVSGNVRAILQRLVNDPIYRALVKEYPDFASKEIEESSFVAFDELHADLIDIETIKDLTPTEFMEHFNFTCRFTTDRGVSHEIVRHRPFSFAQESTRYCNYSKDQFGNVLTICKPTTYDNWTSLQRHTFELLLDTIGQTYNLFTTGDNALQPQQARAVLPNCLKTEIVVSGPAQEWNHFFNLRSKGTTGAPHPDIKVVADMALEKVNNYLVSIGLDRFTF